MDTVTEFQVNMTCQNCVQKVASALGGAEGVTNFDIDLKSQSVIVTSSKPSSEIQTLIENTGKRAVIAGLSSKSKSSAVAMLGGTVGCAINPLLQGAVRFIQAEDNQCVVDGVIDGLSPGYHGLAIHESGDLSGGCDTVGEHYNPRNARHGSPDDEDRHVGDLGNVFADTNGRASFKFTDKLINVPDLIGRSIVVSSDPDDFGRGSTHLSKINGNCGSKLACGIIARSSGLFQNPKRFCACDGVSIWDERDRPLTGPGRSEPR